ncbi:MAG: MAPEG family protein [Pseudomonadota bacterium]
MTFHMPIILGGLALVVLTLLLAFWTSIQRGRSGIIAYNAPLDPASGMAKAQRAHGNAAEFSALLIGLFLITSVVYQGRDLGLAVTSLVVAITVARWLSAIGFLACETLERPHILKAIGALVTYIGGLALTIMTAVKLV